MELSTVSCQPICSGNRFRTRAFESELPLNVKITPQKLVVYAANYAIRNKTLTIKWHKDCNTDGCRTQRMWTIDPPSTSHLCAETGHCYMCVTETHGAGHKKKFNLNSLVRTRCAVCTCTRKYSRYTAIEWSQSLVAIVQKQQMNPTHTAITTDRACSSYCTMLHCKQRI